MTFINQKQLSASKLRSLQRYVVLAVLILIWYEQIAI